MLACDRSMVENSVNLVHEALGPLSFFTLFGSISSTLEVSHRCRVRETERSVKGKGGCSWEGEMERGGKREEVRARWGCYL